VAEAYRDLEQATGRLALIERLAALLAQTPAKLLPVVCYLCQGLIAPEFAGVDLGLAEKLAIRAVATATGVDQAEVAALVREIGDLGRAGEQLLAAVSLSGAADRPADLTVVTVVNTLREIANAEGQGSQGRKLDLLAGLLTRATPLEARYLLRQVTGNLRLGIGTPTILDALAQVYTGGRAGRPVLERAYNICSDLGLVASALVDGGLAAVEQIQVRPGNPVRVMLAQRLADATEILAKLGGECAAEYKYDGMRLQAHRTADGTSSRSWPPGWARPRRSSRARSSRSTRPPTSCARSPRSCSGGASTASPRRYGTCRWGCSASSCSTRTGRT